MKTNVHRNSIDAYRQLPPRSVMQVALAILAQQRDGLAPTANTIGRAIGKPAGSVTGRLDDIRNPKKGAGQIQINGIMYALHECTAVKDPVSGRANAVWKLEFVPAVQVTPATTSPDAKTAVQMTLGL